MATLIRNFGMSQMTIGSCSDFHSKVLSFVNTATPADLHIEGKAEAYKRAVEALAAIVNRQRAFVATKAMKEADQTRDKATGTISAVTNAFLSSPVAAKNEAARLLDPQLSPYKAIRGHEYTKQTAETKGMLAMLDQTANKAAIETLGLTEVVAALRTANEAFEQAFLGKTAEVGDRVTRSDISSRTVVDEANTLYAGIRQTVNAYAIVQPSDAVEAFATNVNGLVGAFARIAGGRSSADAGIVPGGGGDSGSDKESETAGTI